MESIFNNKPYCKISEMLGLEQPKEVVEINGVIVSVKGELNIKKLVEKAVSL